MKRANENKVTEQYTVFKNPYLQGQLILENDIISFQTENTEGDDILGRAWIQKKFSQKSINIEYKESDYTLKFKKEYRFVIIDYNSEAQRFLIEYSKLPWVAYHE